MVEQEATLKALEQLRRFDEVAKRIEQAAKVFAQVADALRDPLQASLGDTPDLEYGTKYNLSVVSLPHLDELGKLLYEFQSLHYQLASTPKEADPNVQELIKQKLGRYRL